MLIVVGIGLVSFIGMFSILMSFIFDKPPVIKIDPRYVKPHEPQDSFSVLLQDDLLAKFEDLEL